ncbi:MAG: ABC transporter substrate-binding protein [Eubacterium sp.]|nr:ABC transporter substrate-binding protein [Eubacterium sp.]
MKKRIFSIMIASAMMLTLLAGCGKAEGTTESKSEEPKTVEATEADTSEDIEEPTEDSAANDVADDTASEDTEPTIDPGDGEATTDRSGNNIVIPANVERIVSMAPSTTRFLIDIGLADKIVAIDTNSYAYASSLAEDVPQFDMMAPDNEAIVSLNPDIIFTSGMSSFGGEDAFQSARDAGICVADIPTSTSFVDIKDDLEFIAHCVHAEDAATDIVKQYKTEIDNISATGALISSRKTILFMISLPTEDYPSIYTFGTGTYLDEMITTIGAENVIQGQEGWVSISEEEAIAMNPDVIVTNVNYVDDVVNVIKSAQGWENVTAIKNGEVYYIDADASNQPNQHVVDAMIEMATQVYPEIFKEYITE